MEEVTARELYKRLIDSGIQGATGSIRFSLADTSVRIDTTDIVGNCIQSWLKQWMKERDIFCAEPANTQSFPDFYLSADPAENLLEIKAFNYKASPAFDIANFEAYCASLETKAYRVNADYLIFGYTMDDGMITIDRVWLKKIWEITGTSSRYALNTQIKRGVIYNIRPVSNFKYGKPPVFADKEEFLKALFLCLQQYRGAARAEECKRNFLNDYYTHYNVRLSI